MNERQALVLRQKFGELGPLLVDTIWDVMIDYNMAGDVWFRIDFLDSAVDLKYIYKIAQHYRNYRGHVIVVDDNIRAHICLYSPTWEEEDVRDNDTDNETD